MSWDACHDQIVAICKGTVTTTRKMGLPSFHHNPRAISEGKLPDSRGFWVEISSMAMKGHITQTLPRWLRYDVDVVTFYKRSADPTELMKAIAADHLAQTTRIGDPTLWGQPTSTIESLFLGDGLIARTELDEVEVDGTTVGLLTRLRLTAEFRAT